eukprot:4019287-Pyramimonas_sp.AAC.1
MGAGALETFVGAANGRLSALGPRRRLVARTGRASPRASRKRPCGARRMPRCRSRAKQRERWTAHCRLTARPSSG